MELESLNLLDTLEESEYDAITKLSATICHTPIALVSLIDRDRQWFKSHHGIDATETPREYAFCAHAILGDEIFIVEDASKDPRFCDNPLVVGEPHVLFYAGVPLKTSRGHKIGTLCVIDNQSSQLSEQQIEALKSLATQIIALFELRRANKELTSLANARMKFLSVINHEMRTPLNIIMGYLDLIYDEAREQSESSTLEFCSHARNASEQLLLMVQDMVDHATLEAGEMKLQMATVELTRLIGDCVRSFKPIGQTQNINFNFQDHEKIQIKTDPQRLKQILLNLLSNAAKYSFSYSQVEITVDSSQANYVAIRVINSGPPITSSVAKHIFDRFYREPTVEKGNIAGFGLGLPIAKQLAQMLGGDLQLESSVNSLTTFVMTVKV